MAEEVAALQYRLEASTARFESQIKRAENVMRRSAGQIERGARSGSRSVDRLGASLGAAAARSAAAAAGFLSIGAALRSVVANGDRLRALEGRFEALTGSAQRAGTLISGAFDISRETGQAVDQVAQLATRFLIAGESVGATDAQVIRFTDSLIKLGQIGGSSAGEIANGTTQLSQALAGGVVRAEEFNSIIENTPFIAKAIADALKVNVGQLRAMVLEGKLLSSTVFDAILGKTAEIDAQFEKLPATLERSTGRLSASWAEFTAEIDRSLGLSERLASVIDGIAAALDSVTSGAKQAAAALSPFGGQTPGALDVSGDKGLERLLQQQDPNFRLTPRAAPAAAAAPARGAGGGRRAASSAAGETFSALLRDAEERIAGFQRERAAVGLTADAAARLTAEYEAQALKARLLAAAKATGNGVSEAEAELVQLTADAYRDAAVATIDAAAAQEALAKSQEAAAASAQKARDDMVAFTDRMFGAIDASNSLSDNLKNLGLQFASLAIQGLQGGGPLGGVLGNLAGSLFGGGGGGIAAPQLISGGLYASGAAFSRGTVIPFASGGVVSGPASFPMSGGRTGLMGEAGPEAILPLKRGPGGKLGVAASGGGSTVINVDARGSTDPAATEAAARRGAAMALATVGERRRENKGYLA